MAGFVGFGTALANILSGQRQGQQEADIYRQQLQSQQLEDQTKRQKLLDALQSQQRYEAARGKLPADQQGKLDLGFTPEELQKQTERTSRANAIADQLYQRGLDASLPIEQRMQALQMSASLRAHPEAVDALPQELKLSGIGEKPSRPFEFVDKDTGAPVMYSGTGPIPPNAVTAGAYQVMHRAPKETATDKAMETPVGLMKGINIITSTGEPWPNPMMSTRDALAAGGITISDKSKDALMQSQAAERGLDTILEAGKRVLPGGTGEFANYLNPAALALKRAGGSPEVADYDSTKIALINHLRIVAGVARVNAQELNQVNSALASANSYPALEAAVKRARAAIANARPNLIKAGRLAAPAAASATAPPANVMFNGKPYASRKGAGGWEFFDPSANSWKAWPPK